MKLQANLVRPKAALATAFTCEVVERGGAAWVNLCLSMVRRNTAFYSKGLPSLWHEVCIIVAWGPIVWHAAALRNPGTCWPRSLRLAAVKHMS